MNILNALFKKRFSKCPSCGADLQRGDVICSCCGYNTVTGEKPDPEDFPPRPVRVWFACPKCGATWEKSGDEKHPPVFGRCYRCGYEESQGDAE